MTRKVFNQKIKKSFSERKNFWLSKPKEDIFSWSYSIAREQSIAQFLLEEDTAIIKKLYPFAESERDLLKDMSSFELNYNEAHWLTWENLNQVVDDFIESIETETID